MSTQEQVCPVCNCSEESCKNCTNESDNCNSLESCCCVNQSHVAWHERQVQKGLALEYFSLGWMSVEVVASIIAGLIIGKSLALLAFAGDSVIELISAFAVMQYVRGLRRKPGFSSGLESERIERVALALLILLVPTIAGGVIFSYFAGLKPEASLLGIAVASGAAIIMPILWIQKRSVGREAKVLALSLDAVESATCFFMSIALLAGLIVNYFFRLAWADYVATGIILFFVVLEIRKSFEEMREE